MVLSSSNTVPGLALLCNLFATSSRRPRLLRMTLCSSSSIVIGCEGLAPVNLDPSIK